MKFQKITTKTAAAYIKNSITHSFIGSLYRNGRRRKRLQLKHNDRFNDLKTQGYTLIPNYLSQQKCVTAVELIKNAFEKYPSFVHETEDKRIFGIEQILPAARKLAQETIFLELGELVNREYTYCAFTLAGWLQAGHGGSSGNGWHRDAFFSQYKAMLYLTDVTDGNGPFEIIPRSHTLKNVLKSIRVAHLDFMQDRYTESEISRVEAGTGLRRKLLTAPAGTLILFNSSSLHRGHPIKSGERVSLTNYYFPVSRDVHQVREQFAPVMTPNEI